MTTRSSSLMFSRLSSRVESGSDIRACLLALSFSGFNCLCFAPSKRIIPVQQSRTFVFSKCRLYSRNRIPTAGVSYPSSSIQSKAHPIQGM